MNQKQINKQIFGRLKKLEQAVFQVGMGDNVDSKDKLQSHEKIPTLREIVKGRKLNNASEKLALIVGYHEKILKSLIHKSKLEEEWNSAKIDGVYRTNLLDNASGVFIRVQPDGMCDLTGTGEDFFDNFLKSDVGDN